MQQLKKIISFLKTNKKNCDLETSGFINKKHDSDPSEIEIMKGFEYIKLKKIKVIK